MKQKKQTVHVNCKDWSNKRFRTESFFSRGYPRKLFPEDIPTWEEIMQKIKVAHGVGKPKAGPNKGSAHIVGRFYSRPL